MPFKTIKTTLAITALPLFLAVSGLSQTTGTGILGLVTDTSGAAVEGAKVTITRKATAEVSARATNSAGEYTFPLVEIGEYTVHVEKQGFRAKTVAGLKVETQQQARVDFTLEIGS